MSHRTILIALNAALALAGSTGLSQAGSATTLVPGVPNSALAVKGAPSATGGGTIVAPKFDPRKPHPHFQIFVPNQGTGGSAEPDAPTLYQNQSGDAGQPQANGPPFPGYYFETPASLACIYGLVARASGCDPNIVTTNAPGGAKTIGIVAFGHDTTVLADLQQYSAQFGLPAPNLTVYYYTGTAFTTTAPPVDQNVSVETSLDVQMAHAMSPNAPIILVEGPALNDVNNDYTNGEARYLGTYAATLQKVSQAGGGVVSASYGGGEFDGEDSYESYFTGSPNVVLFASSGDDPSVSYPATSPNVVAVGGTGTARERQVTSSRGPAVVPTVGQFKEEVAWDQAGGGLSQVYGRPSFQSAIAARIYNQNARATPDVSAVADPQTGVWVFCSTGCGNSSSGSWFGVGGTSVASPVVASMTANKGPLYPTTAQQLAYIYSQIGQSTYFDVARGICGPNAGYTVTTGTAAAPANQYDLCTGIGSPRYTPTSPNASSAQQRTAASR